MYSVDLYARVRRACLIDRMPRREAARVFGIDRKTVDKMLRFSVPPGYRALATAELNGVVLKKENTGGSGPNI